MRTAAQSTQIRTKFWKRRWLIELINLKRQRRRLSRLKNITEFKYLKLHYKPD